MLNALRAIALAFSVVLRGTVPAEATGIFSDLANLFGNAYEYADSSRTIALGVQRIRHRDVDEPRVKQMVGNLPEFRGSSRSQSP